MSRRVLLARCPACDRQHQFASAAQVDRMVKAGRCKFCPCRVCGQAWDEDHEACLTGASPPETIKPAAQSDHSE